MKLRRQKQPAERSLVRQRRTGTDWQRPAAFSYHERRDVRQENQDRQSTSAVDSRRQMLSLRYWLRRSGTLVAVIVALICLVSIASLSTKPRIVFLDSQSGNKALYDPSVYQQAASNQLSSSLLNYNKLTFDSGAARKWLLQNQPELSDVTISLPLIGHRPIYYLKAAAPVLIIHSKDGTSTALSANGRALVPAHALSDAARADLPQIDDQSGTRVTLGKQILSGTDMQFIQTVVKTLAAKQISIAAMTLPAGDINELDVKVAGKAYAIKFNMYDSDTVRQQVGTYLATSSQLTKQGITPAQYIDVRVAGRAYYQ